MNLSSVSYNCSSYSSTNPPVSESSGLLLEKTADGIFLTVYSSYNAAKAERKYRVTAEQYRGIVSLFDSMKIEEVTKSLAGQLSDNMPMVGGYVGKSFSFVKDGETVSVNRVDNTVSQFISRIKNLASGCGEPVFENIVEDKNPPAGAFGFAVPVPAAPEAESAAPVSGGWKCAECGYVNYGGKFCCNCGSKKPD